MNIRWRLVFLLGLAAPACAQFHAARWALMGDSGRNQELEGVATPKYREFLVSRLSQAQIRCLDEGGVNVYVFSLNHETYFVDFIPLDRDECCGAQEFCGHVEVEVVTPAMRVVAYHVR